jgi:hypothetical protein
MASSTWWGEATSAHWHFVPVEDVAGRSSVDAESIA